MTELPSAWAQLVPAADSRLPGQSLPPTSAARDGAVPGRAGPLIAFHRDQQEPGIQPADSRQPAATPSYHGFEPAELLKPVDPHEEWMTDPAIVPAAHAAFPAKVSPELPDSTPPSHGIATGQRSTQTVPDADNPRRLLLSSGISSSSPIESRRINPTASPNRRPLGFANSFPSMNVLRTAGTGLGIALGLLLICAWLYRRNTPSPTTPLPKEVVSVLGRAPLAARQFVQLLRVGNKLVLVSVTPEGMEPITEVTDPVEVDRLLGLCMRNHTQSTTAEFKQVLNQLSREGAKGFLGK